MEAIELSNAVILFLVFSVAAGTIISSVTGMGGGILMFAAMNLYIPLRPLIAIHGSVQICNNATLVWSLRKHIKLAMCIYFFVGMLLGTVMTTLLLVNYVGELIPLLLLGGLILYSVFKPKSLPEIRLSSQGYAGVGLATGVVGMLAGAIDPILAAFFLRKDLTKEEVVANKSLMQFLTHSTKVLAFIYLGFSFSENLALIVLLSLSAIVSAQIGVRLLAKINNQLFYRLMYIAFLLAGIRVVYQIWQQLNLTVFI